MNNEKYKQEFSILSSSGVGVIATRTRESFRCIDSLREWAFSKDIPFSSWNVRDGWIRQLPQASPLDAPEVDKIIDPSAALMSILKKEENSSEPTHGVFVMNSIHPWLAKAPIMIECLKQYARDISEHSSLRVVLIFPEGTLMPNDLKHDIPILDYALPDLEERKTIYQYIMESSVPSSEDVPKIFTSSQEDTICASAGGLTQMEIETAFAKAITLQRAKFPKLNFAEFNSSVLHSKTEVVKNSEVLEIMDSIPMDEVGGLEVYKEWLGVASKCFSPEAKAFGVDTPNGVAVIGSPGTGKSLVAKATASMLGQALVKFDVSKVYGSLVGQSEERTRAAIATIKAMSPCVVLLDEIDKGLGGSHSSGGDSGTSTRVLGTILTEMQEAEEPIFWIASANRVDGLPPELLRKGRFDEVFAVLSPNKVEREEIFKIHLKKRGQKVPEDLDFAVVSSKGYVGAEIEAAVKEAIKEAFVNGKDISGKLLAEQLSMMNPLSEAFPEQVRSMEEWAKNNARIASRSDVEKENKSPVIRKRKRSVK